MIFERLFICKNWVSQGEFAVRYSEVNTNFDRLNQVIDMAQSGELLELLFMGKCDKEYIRPAYCLLTHDDNKVLLVQQLYLNLITDSAPDLYTYRYNLEHRIVSVYDEDIDLVGIVMPMIIVPDEE